MTTISMRYSLRGCQGPPSYLEVIYRALFLQLPPPSILHFLPTTQTISSTRSKSSFYLWAIKWQTRSNSRNVITRTPAFLFLPLTSSSAPSQRLLPPRGNWTRPNFLLSSLTQPNQSDDAGGSSQSSSTSQYVRRRHVPGNQGMRRQLQLAP